MPNETKFTPGPWDTEDDGYVCATNHESDARPIICERANGGSLESDWEANSHLIAAAPELYAVLDEALAALYGAISVCGAIGNLTHARDMAEAALAKARGEA